MDATEKMRRENDAQIPYVGPLRLTGGSVDSRGNTLSTTAASSYYLDAGDTVVEVTIDVAFDYTIYLPPPGEAAGRIYSIRFVKSSSGTCIVDETDDSVDNDLLPKTLDTTLDYIVLFCDGMKWYSVDKETA